MIPKKIHYCWFGRGDKPADAIQCIESWRNTLPEYEIVEWNEDNFDIDFNKYVRQAYDARKFAFVSDVARLYALYNQGGIYMDCDVEVVKPLDELLNFETVAGFETSGCISTALIGAVPGSPIISELLEAYSQRSFVRLDGSFDTTTNVDFITDIMKSYGLILNDKPQTIKGLTILPWEYLSPKSVNDGKVYATDNTLAIHHFAGSWLSPTRRRWNKFKKLIRGYKIKRFVKRILSLGNN